jgi:hypothetical protein
MQDTKTRSVGGMGIKKAGNYLDLERDLNFDVFGIVNILGDNLIDVLDFGLGLGSRRGRSCDVIIMSASCKVFAKTFRYASLARHLFLLATCAAKRFPCEMNALIRKSVSQCPPIARRHAVFTSCKIAYMDYLQRWSFFFSILISGETLLSFGGGAERWTLGLARLLSS